MLGSKFLYSKAQNYEEFGLNFSVILIYSHSFLVILSPMCLPLPSAISLLYTFFPKFRLYVLLGRGCFLQMHSKQVYPVRTPLLPGQCIDHRVASDLLGTAPLLSKKNVKCSY